MLKIEHLNSYVKLKLYKKVKELKVRQKKLNYKQKSKNNLLHHLE